MAVVWRIRWYDREQLLLLHRLYDKQMSVLSRPLWRQTRQTENAVVPFTYTFTHFVTVATIVNVPLNKKMKMINSTF